MSHVFANLLDNAIKYRHRGRKLEITVRGEIKGGKTAVYTISDNGLGIKAGDLPKVLDVFYRAHAHDPAVEPGEGIGLAMAKRMLEKCGGSIRVESKEGEGSAFSVELPA